MLGVQGKNKPEKYQYLDMKVVSIWNGKQNNTIFLKNLLVATIIIKYFGHHTFSGGGVKYVFDPPPL